MEMGLHFRKQQRSGQGTGRFCPFGSFLLLEQSLSAVKSGREMTKPRLQASKAPGKKAAGRHTPSVGRPPAPVPPRRTPASAAPAEGTWVSTPVIRSCCPYFSVPASKGSSRFDLSGCPGAMERLYGRLAAPRCALCLPVTVGLYPRQRCLYRTFFTTAAA